MKTLKAAEGVNITCSSCNRCAQIVLEPIAIKINEDNRPNDKAEVLFCPFCSFPYQKEDFERAEDLKF